MITSNAGLYIESEADPDDPDSENAYITTDAGSVGVIGGSGITTLSPKGLMYVGSNTYVNLGKFGSDVELSFMGPNILANLTTISSQLIKTSGNLTVSGTKSRLAKADEFGKRLLYCYETPTPLFGDVGEGVIDETGLCYVFLDPVFAETITTGQYQVFLQRYGQGDCFVLERKPDYFIVQGEPGLSFGWELKAKQKDFDQLRLDREQEELEKGPDYGELGSSFYIKLEEGRMSA